MNEFNVNDHVRLRKDIIEPADDCAPASCCGKRGDIVIVRHIKPNLTYPYKVSHADRTDGNTFGVAADEIELADRAAKAASHDTNGETNV